MSKLQSGDMTQGGMMPPKEASEADVQILMTGLGFGESPRWHQNRLWFANWGTQQIAAVARFLLD